MITFRNVPTARRSRSTPTPWIVGEYRNVFGSVETRKFGRWQFLKSLARKDKGYRRERRAAEGCFTVLYLLLKSQDLVAMREQLPPQELQHALQRIFAGVC
jgi:hypothetical protein